MTVTPPTSRGCVTPAPIGCESFGGGPSSASRNSDSRSRVGGTRRGSTLTLDRSRLLRDVANALSEQHVNIVACSTHTGNDRVAKMRFEFELADPGHLDSVLRTIKGVDGVYDAYRLVPGKNS